MAQIRDLGLSERQVRALLRMRRLYLENLGALMRRRQELSVKLQVRRTLPSKLFSQRERLVCRHPQCLLTGCRTLS